MTINMNYNVEKNISNMLILDEPSPCDVFSANGDLLLVKGEQAPKHIVEMASKQETYTIHAIGEGIRWLYYDATLFPKQKIDNSLALLQKSIQIMEETNLIVPLNQLKKFDPATYSHSINVAMIAIQIGTETGYSQDMLYELSIAALLHDIGKLRISQSILLKPESLTKAEYDSIKQHPEYGAELLHGNAPLDVEISIIQHHERYNGTGYPNRLCANKIHLNAQIIAIADVFDALTSNRPYRRSLPPYHALEIIEKGKDQEYSADLVNAFLKTVSGYSNESLVTLDNGESGIVMKTSILNPTRPTVQILFDRYGNPPSNQQLVNLEHQNDRYITKVQYKEVPQIDIMLIDDDEDCILGLAEAIEPMGHSCELFTVPEKAIESFRHKPTDVVITDLRMPGMSGIEVLKKIKNLSPETQVILVTGYGDDELAAAAANNGAFAFFSKPIDVFQIIEMLEKISANVKQKKRSCYEYQQLYRECRKTSSNQSRASKFTKKLV